MAATGAEQCSHEACNYEADRRRSIRPRTGNSRMLRRSNQPLRLGRSTTVEQYRRSDSDEYIQLRIQVIRYSSVSTSPRKKKE